MRPEMYGPIRDYSSRGWLYPLRKPDNQILNRIFSIISFFSFTSILKRASTQMERKIHYVLKVIQNDQIDIFQLEHYLRTNYVVFNKNGHK